MTPQGILSQLHKIPQVHKNLQAEPQCNVKTVLTWDQVLWHCRLSLGAEREMEIIMPKAEWGVKRTCSSCSVRFYDLTRDPIICPKCGAELDISVPVKSKRAKPVAKAAAKVAAKVVAKDEDLIDDDDDIETDVVDDDADVSLDDDDDGDDVVAVKVKGGDGDDGDDATVIEEDVLLDDNTDDEDVDDDDDAVGDSDDPKGG